MPSSYTLSCRFTLQATGENNNTWGTILNTGVFALVDFSIAGRLAFNLSGTKTLTTALGAADEARAGMLDVTGGTGGQIVIPASSKGYFIRNAASGDVQVTAGGAPTFTFHTGDIGPVWTDGAAVYGLQIAGLSLRDFITSQVTGGGNLPSPAGNLGKTLVVQDHGLGPTWLPGLIGAAQMSPGTALANLGYTPANKAGDVFTGSIFAPGLYLGASTRFLIHTDEVGHFSNLVWDTSGASSAYTQYDWTAHSIVTVIGGVAVSQLDAAGNQNFAGFMRAANIQVGGPIFTLSRSATTSFIVFDTAVNAFLQYDSPSGQLGFFIGAVPKFTVDGAGNGNFAGTLTAANITPSDGSVTTAKLAANSVTTPKIADANVTAAKLAAGAAVANIGYTPTNKAGDTITGAFGVTGNLSVGGSVSVGAGSQVSLSSDGATFTQVMLHAATNFFLRLDWATGKLTYFTNNVAVMSIDAGGTIRATNFLLAPP